MYNPENPHVADEFYFIHAKQAFDEKIFSVIHRGNVVVATFIGVLSTTLLLYLIIATTPKQFREFSKLLIVCCFVDYYYLFSLYLFNARTKVEDSVTLLSFRGPIKSFSHQIQCHAYILRSTSPIAAVVTLPVLFYARLYSIKYKVSPSNMQIISYIGLAIAAVSVTAILTPFVYCQPYNGINYGALWYPEPRIPHLLVSDPERNIFALITAFYSRIVMYSSYLLSIYFAYATVKELQRNRADFSPKTVALHSQFTFMLFFQLLLPLLIILPNILFAVLLYADVEFDYSADLLVLPIAWCPATNAISTIFLIHPYKNAAKRLFFKIDSPDSAHPSSVHQDSRNLAVRVI
ncbi:hypothetical protein M3Y95_01105900 [Aphelenchoides besseyi]|nr:hypothetical protein M3Y95_01105900 [Aphelenchoides besseyi]